MFWKKPQLNSDGTPRILSGDELSDAIAEHRERLDFQNKRFAGMPTGADLASLHDPMAAATEAVKVAGAIRSEFIRPREAPQVINRRSVIARVIAYAGSAALVGSMSVRKAKAAGVYDKVFLPQWVGGIPDGTTDNTAAINQGLNVFDPQAGGQVMLTQGVWGIATSASLTLGSNLNVALTGVPNGAFGPSSAPTKNGMTVLKALGANDMFSYLPSGNTGLDVLLMDLIFYANNTAPRCVNINSVGGFRAVRCSFWNPTVSGFVSGGSNNASNIELDECYANSCPTTAYTMAALYSRMFKCAEDGAGTGATGLQQTGGNGVILVCHFEGNATACVVGATNGGTRFLGNQLPATHAGSTNLQLQSGASAWLNVGNNFAGNSTGIGADVQSNAHTEIFVANEFSGCLIGIKLADTGTIIAANLISTITGVSQGTGATTNYAGLNSITASGANAMVCTVGTLRNIFNMIVSGAVVGCSRCDPPVSLTDGASIAVDASKGDVMLLLTAQAAPNFLAPTNPSNGQRLLIQIFPTGGTCNPTFTGGGGGYSLTGPMSAIAVNHLRNIEFTYNSAWLAGAGSWVQCDNPLADVNIV